MYDFNVKCKIMFTKAYLELSKTYMKELFPLRLNHILKM